jgi:excisionase family DNA binding protein
MSGMKIGDETVLTLKEAAELIELSPQTLYLQVRNGKLNATKKGREWLVLESEIRRYERDVKGKHGFASPNHPPKRKSPAPEPDGGA